MAASCVICKGDSLTAGFGLPSPSTQSYPSQMAGLLDPLTNVVNLGVSGQLISEHADATDVIASLATNSGYARRTVALLEGINDCAAFVSSATIISAIHTWISNVRAADPGAILVGVTLLPSTTITGGAETARLAVNTDIKTVANFDYVLDAAANANLSDPSNTTYYQADGLHLSIAGALVMATIERNLLVANGRADPLPFTFTALTATNLAFS